VARSYGGGRAWASDGAKGVGIDGADRTLAPVEAGRPARGVGIAGRHHGEIIQGAVRRGGELLPCLITMPVGGVGSTARYVSAETLDGLRLYGSGDVPGIVEAEIPRRRSGLEVLPAWKRKAERAALLALAFIGAAPRGRLEIECNVATGVGLGSSTCDVVAAIRAVCSFYGIAVGAADIARLAIEAEGAADPLMFDREMVLFAQRHGRVLESLGDWAPRYTLLSIYTDEGSLGVDTLSLPLPDYVEAELSVFEDMVDRARVAFRAHYAPAIAAIATESAALNQRFLPLRHFHQIRELADQYGALGVQISHSGTVGGVLFDESRDVQSDQDFTAQLSAEVRSLGLRPLGLFTTGR
jgi:uncharacterized protein involved in propanediol utilization